MILFSLCVNELCRGDFFILFMTCVPYTSFEVAFILDSLDSLGSVVSQVLARGLVVYSIIALFNSKLLIFMKTLMPDNMPFIVILVETSFNNYKLQFLRYVIIFLHFCIIKRKIFTVVLARLWKGTSFQNQNWAIRCFNDVFL